MRGHCVGSAPGHGCQHSGTDKYREMHPAALHVPSIQPAFCVESTLVTSADDRAEGHPCASRREHRLFDVTRVGGSTLLSFADAPAIENSPVDLRSFRVVEQPTSPDEIADKEGYLAGAYGASEHTLVLIRPDGYIAFHRAIGGGIEFGETAEVALRREFVEELGVELGAVKLLGVVENIFEYEGHPGHEIAHVFAVDSSEIDAIPLDSQLEVLDEGSPIRWVPIVGTPAPFYPTGIARILDTITRQGSRL